MQFMMPRTHSAGATCLTTFSAAKLTFLCILASSILQCAMAHPVDMSLSNVCDYAHLSKCVWEDLVKIRNEKSVASYTLPILDIMALEVASAGYVKSPRSKQDQPNIHILQHRNSVCKWSYKLDVDYLRVPVHVATAVLDDASTSRYYHIGAKTCQCVPVKVKLPVTTFHTCSSGKEKWRMEKMNVNAGYTCKG